MVKTIFLNLSIIPHSPRFKPWANETATLNRGRIHAQIHALIKLLQKNIFMVQVLSAIRMTAFL